MMLSLEGHDDSGGGGGSKDGGGGDGDDGGSDGGDDGGDDGGEDGGDDGDGDGGGSDGSGGGGFADVTFLALRLRMRRAFRLILSAAAIIRPLLQHFQIDCWHHFLQQHFFVF